MLDRISRTCFGAQKNQNVALSKAADLTPDMSDAGVNTRTAPFIISTPAVDRDGDTLALDGWDLADYENNPIVLFDHDPKSPIGTALSTFVKDNALRSVAFFPTKDVNELSDWAYNLIEAKILRTASVTFQPIEYTVAADRASQSPWGMPPMNFLKQKLLEWSVVSVPSNQEALHTGKGLSVDWRAYHRFIEQRLDEGAPLLAAPRAEYEKTCAIVKGFLSSARRQGPPAMAQVTKAALPFKKTPLADEDTPWDGPKETAAASVDDLKAMCAWVDPDNKDTKSGYKLPHHQAKAPHKLVWNGVKAAMGALLGARGGTKIPDADRKAVYDHLAKSYREFGKTPPDFKSLRSGVQKTMIRSKAGKVLNKDNVNRLKAAMKHAEKADEFHEKACDMHDKAMDMAEKCKGLHEKALDMHAKTKAHNEKCAEHMKAIMDSHQDGEEDPSNTGDDESKSGAEESEGSEEDVSGQSSDKPGAAGSDQTVSGEGEAEDYYEQYSEGKLPKSASDDDSDDGDDEDEDDDRREKTLARRARAAIAKSGKPTSILDEEVTEEDIAAAMRTVIDRAFDNHVRTLRGQD